MQKIEQLKLELSKAIKESPEYIEYKRLEAIIDKDPNLKRSIDEFRRQTSDSRYLLTISCLLISAYLLLRSSCAANISSTLPLFCISKFCLLNSSILLFKLGSLSIIASSLLYCNSRLCICKRGRRTA